MEYVTTEAERRYRTKHYRENHEKKLEYARQYREKHKESIREYQRSYAKTHDRSEYFRRRYLKKKAEERKRELQEMFGGD